MLVHEIIKMLTTCKERNKMVKLYVQAAKKYYRRFQFLYKKADGGEKEHE